MSVNKVLLLGRLGQDPELKFTPSGQPVCNFSVATSESWTDKNGQKQEKTEWSRIVVWGKLAELCNQYLAKGRQVFIEGKLATRSWEDQQGQKKYATEIVASTVQFIGGNAGANATAGNNAQANTQAAPQQNTQAAPQQGYDNNFAADDIPF